MKDEHNKKYIFFKTTIVMDDRTCADYKNGQNNKIRRNERKYCMMRINKCLSSHLAETK